MPRETVEGMTSAHGDRAFGQIGQQCPGRRQSGHDVGVKTASCDFGFKQLNDVGRAKPLDRIHKIQSSPSPLLGSVRHQTSPKTREGDCNQNVLASIKDSCRHERSARLIGALVGTGDGVAVNGPDRRLARWARSLYFGPAARRTCGSRF
jgi:hypothetical protein